MASVNLDSYGVAAFHHSCPITLKPKPPYAVDRFLDVKLPITFQIRYFKLSFPLGVYDPIRNRAIRS